MADFYTPETRALSALLVDPPREEWAAYELRDLTRRERERLVIAGRLLADVAEKMLDEPEPVRWQRRDNGRGRVR